MRCRLSLRRGGPADPRKTPKSGDGPAGRGASYQGVLSTFMGSACARCYALVASMQVGRRRDFKDKVQKKCRKSKNISKASKCSAMIAPGPNGWGIKKVAAAS